MIEILHAAPDVKLLVTSRERLNVQEEWVLALDGLAFPNDQPIHPLETYTSVQLFVERARQAQARFSLDDNAQAVQAICRSVEGMPLGLELAATWLRAMTCAQIAAHITGSLNFLTTPLRNVPERHRSLRVVFEQSWKLLSEEERAVLMRLSIFRGGFDLEAADPVAGATLSLLAGLLDKSLVRLSPAGRYDLHELLRQYAADKLADANEVSTTIQRHFEYFLKMASSAETHRFGSEQVARFDQLELELDNLRAALAWSVETENGLRLAGVLSFFFDFRMHWQEGVDWLRKMLSANPDAPVSLRAPVLNHIGTFMGQLGDVEQGRALCEQALSLARAANDRWNIALALSHLGFQLSTNIDQSPALLEESLSLFRELADHTLLSHVLMQRTFVAVDQADYAYARVLIDEALVLARAANDKFVMAWIHHLSGKVSWLQDRDALQARTHFERSVALFEVVHHLEGLTVTLEFLATIERVLGSTAHAQALFQQALRLLQEKAHSRSALPPLILLSRDWRVSPVRADNSNVQPSYSER